MIGSVSQCFHIFSVVCNQAEGYNSLTRINNNILKIASQFGFKRGDDLQSLCDQYETSRDAASLFEDLTYITHGKIASDWKKRKYGNLSANILSIMANAISSLEHLDNLGIHLTDENSLIGNWKIYGRPVFTLRKALSILGKSAMLLSTAIKAGQALSRELPAKYQIADRDSDIASTVYYAADLCQECLFTGPLTALTVSLFGIISGAFGARKQWAKQELKRVEEPLPQATVKHIPNPHLISSANHYLFMPVLKILSMLHSRETDAFDKNFKFTGALCKWIGHTQYGMEFPDWLNTAIKVSGRLSLYNNVPGFFSNANAFNPANPQNLLKDPWSLIWVLKVFTRAGYALNKFFETGVLLERTQILPKELTQIAGSFGSYRLFREVNDTGLCQYFKDIFVIQPSITDSISKHLQSPKWSLDLFLTHLGNSQKIYLCNWFRKWIPLFGTTPLQFNWWLSAEQQADPTYAITNNRFHILFHTIALITTPTLATRTILANWRKP